MQPATALVRSPDSSPVSAPRHQFRFRLLPLGLFTGLFEPEVLREAIREGCADGYRLVRRELTVEPRRILFFLQALALGLVFRRTSGAEESEHDWRVAIYKTRLLTKTADPKALEKTLNDAAKSGFELHFAIKFPTRFLLFFPRESYVFLFRRPVDNQTRTFQYSVSQTPYRFFTRTIENERYEADLNARGAQGEQLKISFRDERRVFGALVQPTALAIFERQG